MSQEQQAKSPAANHVLSIRRAEPLGGSSFGINNVCLTRCVLMFLLSGAILSFVRDNTTRVEGVGDICSFAAFDFQRHGNGKYGAPVHAAKHQRSRQGKMEKSFLTFTATYPTWQAPAQGLQMLSTLSGNVAGVQQPQPQQQGGQQSFMPSEVGHDVAGGGVAGGWGHRSAGFSSSQGQGLNNIADSTAAAAGLGSSRGDGEHHPHQQQQQHQEQQHQVNGGSPVDPLGVAWIQQQQQDQDGEVGEDVRMGLDNLWNEGGLLCDDGDLFPEQEQGQQQQEGPQHKQQQEQEQSQQDGSQEQQRQVKGQPLADPAGAGGVSPSGGGSSRSISWQDQQQDHYHHPQQQQRFRPHQLQLPHQQQQQGSEQWEQLGGVISPAGFGGLPGALSPPSGGGLASAASPGVQFRGSVIRHSHHQQRHQQQQSRHNQQQQQQQVLGSTYSAQLPPQHWGPTAGATGGGIGSSNLLRPSMQGAAAAVAGSGVNHSAISYHPLHSPGHHVLQLYPSTLYPGGPSAAAGLGLGSALYPGRGLAGAGVNPSLAYSRFQAGDWGAGSVVQWGLGGAGSMAGSGASEFLPTNETDDLGSRLAVSHSMLQGFYESQDLTVQHRQQNRLHAKSAMFFAAGGSAGGQAASGSGIVWGGQGPAAAGGDGMAGNGGALSMYIPPRPVWQ